MPFDFADDLKAANRRIAIVRQFTTRGNGNIITLKGAKDDFFEKVKPQIDSLIIQLDYQAGDDSYRFNHVELIPPSSQATNAKPVELQRDHPLFDLIGSNLPDGGTVQDVIVDAGARVAEQLVHALDVLASQRHTTFMAPLVLLAHYYALLSQCKKIQKEGKAQVSDAWQGIFASHPDLERAIFARLTCSIDKAIECANGLKDAFLSARGEIQLLEDAEESYAEGISNFRMVLEESRTEDDFLKMLIEDKNYKPLFNDIKLTFNGNKTISTSGKENTLLERYKSYMRAKRIVMGFVKQPVNSALMVYWFFMNQTKEHTVTELQDKLTKWIEKKKKEIECNMSDNDSTYVRTEVKKRQPDFNKTKQEAKAKGYKPIEIEALTTALTAAAEDLREDLVIPMFNATQTMEEKMFINKLVKAHLSSTVVVNETIIKIKKEVTEDYNLAKEEIYDWIKTMYKEISDNRMTHQQLKNKLEKQKFLNKNAESLVTQLKKQISQPTEVDSISVRGLACAWAIAVDDIIANAVDEAGKLALGTISKEMVSADSHYRWQLQRNKKSHIGGYVVLPPNKNWFGNHLNKRKEVLYKEFRETLQGIDLLELIVPTQDATTLVDVRISLEGDEKRSIIVSYADEEALRVSTSLNGHPPTDSQTTENGPESISVQNKSNSSPESVKVEEPYPNEHPPTDSQTTENGPESISVQNEINSSKSVNSEDNKSEEPKLVKLVVKGPIGILYEGGNFIDANSKKKDQEAEIAAEKIRNYGKDQSIGQLGSDRTQEVQKSLEEHLNTLERLAVVHGEMDKKPSIEKWRRLSRAVLFGEEIVAEQGPYGLGEQDFSALLGLCWGLVKDCLNDKGDISDDDRQVFNWTQYLKIPIEESARNEWIASLETWLRKNMIGSISNAERYLALVKTLDGLTKEAADCEIIIYDGFIRSEVDAEKLVAQIGKIPVLFMAQLHGDLHNQFLIEKIGEIKESLSMDDYKKMRLPIVYKLNDVGWPISNSQDWPKAMRLNPEELKNKTFEQAEKNIVPVDQVFEVEAQLVPFFALVSSGNFGNVNKQNSKNNKAAWYPGEPTKSGQSFGDYLRLCWSRVPDLVALVVLSTFVEFISRARGRIEHRQTYGQIATGLQNDFLNHLPSAIRNNISSVNFHYNGQKLFFTEIGQITSLAQITKLILTDHDEKSWEIPIDGSLKEALESACEFYDL